MHSMTDTSNHSLMARYPNLHLQPPTNYVRYLHTQIRDQQSDTRTFVHYANILLTMLVQEAVNQIPATPNTITTPTNADFHGLHIDFTQVCCVSILRAAESMEIACRNVIPDVAIGKMLIQRDEKSSDKQAQLYWSKLPPSITQYKTILLCDPMLATANSVLIAIAELLKLGIKQQSIVFVNVVSAPEGLERLFKQYPDVRVVCSMVDERLNDQKYIVSGLGDFGDRYFGT